MARSCSSAGGGVTNGGDRGGAGEREDSTRAEETREPRRSANNGSEGGDPAAAAPTVERRGSRDKPADDGGAGEEDERAEKRLLRSAISDPDLTELEQRSATRSAGDQTTAATRSSGGWRYSPVEEARPAEEEAGMDLNNCSSEEGRPAELRR